MSSKITYNDFVDALSRQTGQTKNTSDQFIKELISLVTGELQSTGRSGITNLGAFKVVEMSEREGVNPQTGETMLIPAGKRVSFSAFKALKEQLNEDMGDQEIIIPPVKKASEPESSEAKDLAEEDKSKQKDSVSPASDALKTDSDKDKAVKSDKKGKQDNDFVVRVSTASDDKDVFEKQLLGSSKSLGTPKKSSKSKVTQAKPKAVKKPPKQDRSNAYLYAAIIFVVCFTGFAIWYFASSGQTGTQTDLQPRTFMVDSTSELDQQQDQTEPALILPAEPTEQQEVSEPDLSENVTTETEETVDRDTEAFAAEADNTTVKTFVVEQNDWLYVIAKEVYGTSRFWPLIFEANPAYISDPDLVYESTELQIPALDGQKGAPSLMDYERLAEASRLVADRYDDYNQPEKAQEYREYAGYYQMIANGEREVF